MSSQASPLVEGALAALLASVDEGKLHRELVLRLPARPESDAASGASAADAPEPPRDLLSKIVLADILDEEILEARAGEKTFPLRLFFGQLGASLLGPGGDLAFALASGLNFYFRSDMPEEERARVGFEVSRLYYRFAEGALERPLVAQVSPLLASLLGAQLTRLRFESVDHASVFDSALHEREPGASPQSGRLVRPASFACVVASNRMVRAKARVWT